jgi:uncharacterized damage-inducible protein DinB
MQLVDLFSNYFTVRKELVEAVKDLTPEQLAWQFEQHPANIGQLLSHIAGAEAWWIQAVATDGCEYAPGMFERFDRANSLETCLALLEETLELTTRFLEEASTENWDEVFYRVKGVNEDDHAFDYKVSQRWLVWHVVEHQARHRGQIFTLMRAQGLEVPNV